MKKAVLLLAVLVIAGTVTVYWTYFDADTDEQSDQHAADAGNGAEAADSAAANVGVLHADIASIDTDEPTGLDDALRALEQEKWKISRGYFTEETRYIRSASIESLKMLADQGSTHALRQLGARSISRNPRLALAYYEHAVLLGDTPALLTVSSVWANQRVYSETNSLFAGTQDPPINALALALTAIKRGDNVVAPRYLESLLTLEDFTDDMINDACIAADHIYQALSAKRAGLGHPGFDNTPSPYGDDTFTNKCDKQD